MVPYHWKHITTMKSEILSNTFQQYDKFRNHNESIVPFAHKGIVTSYLRECFLPESPTQKCAPELLIIIIITIMTLEQFF